MASESDDRSELTSEAQSLAEKRSSSSGVAVRSRVIGGSSKGGLTDLMTVDAFKAETVDESNAATIKGPTSMVISGFQVVEPPWDPLTLLQHHWNSSALRQNVDAYGVNIHAHGYHFEARYDLADKASLEDLTDAIRFDDPKISDSDLEDRIEEIRAQIKREKIEANLFFKFCCTDMSFTDLRRAVSMEKETIGHAFWEVRRNVGGKIAAFNYVPGWTFRALASTDKKRVEYTVPVMTSPLAWDERTEQRDELLWAQIDVNQNVRAIFKPLGDKRIISAATGRSYESIELLKDEEPEALPATELIQFKVFHPISACYGVVRWIGNLKYVIGGRKAEFVNLIYFENKSVPPLALLVSGGSVTEDAVSKIESYIEDEISGDAANFHKILIIEAEPAGESMDPLNSGKVRIELVPLTSAIHDDALFMKYIASGREYIGESFRNPRIVRGSTEGINRATALAALGFAESQVYGPERQSFDWAMNRWIMPDLGIVHLEFVSNSPVSTDLDAATAIAELTKAGILRPSEARKLTARVFNVELEAIDELWTQQPLQLTLAGALTSGSGVSTGEAERQSEGTVSEAVTQMRNLVEMCREADIDPVGPLADVMALAAKIKAEPIEDAPPEVVTLRLPGPISRYIQ